VVLLAVACSGVCSVGFSEGFLGEDLVGVHAPGLDDLLECLDLGDACLGADGEAACGVDVSEELDALHLDVVVCADFVAHHVVDVVSVHSKRGLSSIGLTWRSTDKPICFSEYCTGNQQGPTETVGRRGQNLNNYA